MKNIFVNSTEVNNNNQRIRKKNKLCFKKTEEKGKMNKTENV